jgi:hypothetical protein
MQILWGKSLRNASGCFVVPPRNDGAINNQMLAIVVITYFKLIIEHRHCERSEATCCTQ